MGRTRGRVGGSFPFRDPGVTENDQGAADGSGGPHSARLSGGKGAFGVVAASATKQEPRGARRRPLALVLLAPYAGHVCDWPASHPSQRAVRKAADWCLEAWGSASACRDEDPYSRSGGMARPGPRDELSDLSCAHLAISAGDELAYGAVVGGQQVLDLRDGSAAGKRWNGAGRWLDGRGGAPDLTGAVEQVERARCQRQLVGVAVGEPARGALRVNLGGDRNREPLSPAASAKPSVKVSEPHPDA
jgi:hypothetical protein